MDKSKFFGPDASNEISLLEYGVLVYSEPHIDGSGTHFVIYKQGHDQYGTAHVSESDINNLVSGKDWASDDDCKEYLECCGQSLKEWLQMAFPHKLQSLVSYWGPLNIYGQDCCPMSESEAIERYL